MTTAQKQDAGEAQATLFYRLSSRILPAAKRDLRIWWTLQVRHYLTEIDRVVVETAGYRVKRATVSKIRDVAKANEKMKLLIEGNLESLALEGGAIASDLVPVAYELPQRALVNIAKREAGVVARRTNQETLKQVRGLVEKLSNEQELSVDAVKQGIRQMFGGYNNARAELIARTETIKTLNSASVESWRASGLVDKKEWYATLDSRSCQWCGQLHEKEFGLDETLYHEGDRLVGDPALVARLVEEMPNNPGATANDGPGIDPKDPPRTLRFNFGDVQTPPLHPRCRCTLLPVID